MQSTGLRLLTPRCSKQPHSLTEVILFFNDLSFCSQTARMHRWRALWVIAALNIRLSFSYSFRFATMMAVMYNLSGTIDILFFPDKNVGALTLCIHWYCFMPT